MAVETGVLLFFALIQLAAVPLLLRSEEARGRGRQMAYLTGLLVLNGVVVFLGALRSVGFTDVWVDIVSAAVDAPTGYLVLALGLELLGRRRSAVVAALVGIVPAMIVAADPPLEGVRYLAIVSAPYYAGLAIVVIHGARSASRVDHWIALAFMPRAVLFGSQTLFPALRSGELAPIVALGGLMNLGVAALALVGAWLLFRNPASPGREIVLACALLGPADAIALMVTPDDAVVARAILNFLTMAFVRPLLLMVGFAPSMTRGALVRTLLVAGLSAAFVEAAPAMALPRSAAMIVVASLGSLALALLGPRARPAAGVGPPPSGSPAEPQWVRVVRALAGSSTAPPRAEWTQAGLARATGLRVQRVQAIPPELERTAAAKLDVYVPDWRERHADPSLIRVRKGAVPGVASLRVHYQLTPAGEELAARLRDGFAKPPGGF